MQIIFLSKKFESYQIISEHLSDKEGIYIWGLKEVLNEKQKNQAKILYFFFLSGLGLLSCVLAH